MAKRKYTHWWHKGSHHSSLYHRWYEMVARCTNPTHRAYHNYGARGIGVSDEWLESWDAFADWSFRHGYEEGLVLDRINNDDDYRPDNCRWVTWADSCKNRRVTISVTIDGRTQTLVDWADELGLKYHTLWARHRKGSWPSAIDSREVA